MLDWLYNRVSNAVIKRLEEWLSKPKNIEQLTLLVDNLFDREVKRLMASVSASQKGGIPELGTGSGGIDIAGLLTGKGGLSSKKLIGTAIQWLLQSKQGQQTQSGSLP